MHALTDHRRILPVEKRSVILNAHENFLLVLSYNPGYQSVLKDLKPSTRQRFVSLEFDYPPHDHETRIIAHESGMDPGIAADLATLGAKVRHLRHHSFEEGVSTRLLVYAGQLIARGIEARRACDVAICRAITDDADVQRAVAELVATIFP
jgi:nitric oxide reductase NorQ protein